MGRVVKGEKPLSEEEALKNKRVRQQLERAVSKAKDGSSEAERNLAEKVKSRVLTLSPHMVRAFAEAWQKNGRNMSSAFAEFEQTRADKIMRAEKHVGHQAIHSMIVKALGYNEKAARHYERAIEEQHPELVLKPNPLYGETSWLYSQTLVEMVQETVYETTGKAKGMKEVEEVDAAALVQMPRTASEMFALSTAPTPALPSGTTSGASTPGTPASSAAPSAAPSLAEVLPPAAAAEGGSAEAPPPARHGKVKKKKKVPNADEEERNKFRKQVNELLDHAQQHATSLVMTDIDNLRRALS
ncbi:MAG: hypothetical protein GY772_24110 [bacterium]|nr:hypothetical protein [bacterium]